jgi:hypothetical protein
MARRGMLIGYWWKARRDHWEDQDIDGWTILKLIIERYDGKVWIGLIWIRLGISGGLL